MSFGVVAGCFLSLRAGTAGSLQPSLRLQHDLMEPAAEIKFRHDCCPVEFIRQALDRGCVVPRSLDDHVCLFRVDGDAYFFGLTRLGYDDDL